MLVRKRGRDDLDQLARRRRELGEPGNAAALLSAVAEDFELDDVLAGVNRRGSVKWCADALPATGVDPAELRLAIHDACKVAITYVDETGHRTHRTVRPIAMAYYVDVTLLGAWCELRSDFRNFRVDRISNAQLLDERFLAESGKLMAEWLALPKHRPGLTTFEPKQQVSHPAAI